MNTDLGTEDKRPLIVPIGYYVLFTIILWLFVKNCKTFDRTIKEFRFLYSQTCIYLSYIDQYFGDKIFLKKEGLYSISDKKKTFWRDILLNLSQLLPILKTKMKTIL